MNITTVTARELLRDQKSILERVRATGQPAIVVTNREPQVAILPLEDMEELRRLRQKEALDKLMKLVEGIALGHTGTPLPSDLAENHDEYLAEAYEKDLNRIHQN
jgi:prevent-host-death family protein